MPTGLLSSERSYPKSQEDNDKNEESLKHSDQILLTSVPLKHLTRKYQNAGFRELTFNIIDDKLQFDCYDRCVRLILAFEHVT